MGVNKTSEGTCERHDAIFASSLSKLSLNSKDDSNLSELEQSLAAISLGSNGEEQRQLEDAAKESVEKVGEKQDVAEVKEEEVEKVVEAEERNAKVEAGTDVKELTKEGIVRVDEEEKVRSEEITKEQDNKTDERKVDKEDKQAKKEENENKEGKLAKKEENENKEGKLAKKEENENKEGKLAKKEEDQTKEEEDGEKKKVQHASLKILNTEYDEEGEDKVQEQEKDEGDCKPLERVDAHQDAVAEKVKEEEEDEVVVKREEAEEEDVINALEEKEEEEDHSDDENEPDEEEEEVDVKQKAQKKPKKKLISRGLNSEFSSYNYEYGSGNQCMQQDPAFCWTPQEPSSHMYGGSSPQHAQTPPIMSPVYPGMSPRNNYSMDASFESRHNLQSYNQLQPQPVYNQHQHFISQAPGDPTFLQHNQLYVPDIYRQQDPSCMANMISGPEQVPDFGVLLSPDVCVPSQTPMGMTANIPMPNIPFCEPSAYQCQEDQQGSPPYSPQMGAPQDSEYSNEEEIQEVIDALRHEALNPNNTPVSDTVFSATKKELGEVMSKSLAIQPIPYVNELFGKIYRKLGRMTDMELLDQDNNGDHLLLIAACREMGQKNHTEFLMALIKRQESIDMCCGAIVANGQCARCFNSNRVTFHSSLSLENHQDHTILSTMITMGQPKVFVEYVLQYLREADITRVFTHEWLPFYQERVRQYPLLDSFIHPKGALIAEEMQRLLKICS